MPDKRPSENEYLAYYGSYIDSVDDGHIVDTLRTNWETQKEMLEKMDESNLSFSYAEGKWTIAQLLMHMADVERVMAYRAFCIARGEQISIPGFDHDAYVDAAPWQALSLDDLISDLDTLRRSTISLFSNFSPVQYDQIGKANNAAVSVRALAFIIAGHHNHHIKILKERYLSS